MQSSHSLQTNTSELEKRENQSVVPRARPEQATLILWWSFSSQTLPYLLQEDLATQVVRNVQARKDCWCSLEGEDEGEKISVLWKAGFYCLGYISIHSARLRDREPCSSWNILLQLCFQKLHVDSVVNGKRLENFPSSSLIHEKSCFSQKKKKKGIRSWGGGGVSNKMFVVCIT